MIEDVSSRNYETIVVQIRGGIQHLRTIFRLFLIFLLNLSSSFDIHVESVVTRHLRTWFDFSRPRVQQVLEVIHIFKKILEFVDVAEDEDAFAFDVEAGSVEAGKKI
jgi:hypothetical protein